MAQTATLTETWTLGTTTVSQTNNFTDEAAVQLDVPVNDGQTDQESSYTLDISELKLLYMVSDVAMTLETNLANGTVDVFALAANIPVVWNISRFTATLVPIPFSVDITTLFLTNASGTNGTFKLRELHDTTP